MKSRRKPMCPFVENPSEKCYVARMDSRAVEKAIRFCRGIYETCEIYLKRMSLREPLQTDVKTNQKTATGKDV